MNTEPDARVHLADHFGYTAPTRFYTNDECCNSLPGHPKTSPSGCSLGAVDLREMQANDELRGRLALDPQIADECPAASRTGG